MNTNTASNKTSSHSTFLFQASLFIGRATPRLAIAGVTGFYILGYAYANGWMAAIDQIAMKVMRHYEMGYIAIGALMPTVQWYAAWGVRVTGGLAAGVAYDLTERIAIIVYKRLFQKRADEREVPRSSAAAA